MTVPAAACLRVAGACATLAAVVAAVTPGVIVIPARAEPQAAAEARPHTAASDDMTRRLAAYHERIATEARRLPPRAPLAAFVGPVLALAAERSTTAPAAMENRAALLALALYINNWSPAMIVPEASGWPAAVRRDVVIDGRDDLARHFVLAAVIQAAAGTAVAALAGVSKELADARDGSGFSFSDVAADRAGARFGALAAGSDASAQRLHVKLAAGLSNADLMPTVEGLPDHLSEREFTRRFGAVGSPAFTAVVDEIDRRIAALPLYR